MMAQSTLNVDAKTLASKVTLQITIQRGRRWQWRIAIGAWLIRLAALIMWVPIEMEFK